MSTELTTSAPANLDWFKSSHSGSDGGDCVEVATTPDTIHIRDSKHRQGPVLHVPATGWAAFLSYTQER